MGLPGCPCVPIAHEIAANGCFNVALAGGLTACYPKSYGNGCAAWDLNLEPHCGESSEEQMCNQPWCYVSSDCDVASSESGHAHRRYSYSTCGALDFTASVL